MEKLSRFILEVSDGRRETASTHSEAWCRMLELWRPGVRVVCADTEARQRATDEHPAAERAQERTTPAS